MDSRVKAMLAGSGLALAVGIGGVASAGEAAAGVEGTKVACGGGGAELRAYPGVRDGQARQVHLRGELDLGTCITHVRPSVTSGTLHLRAKAKASCDSRTTASGIVRAGHAEGFIRWDDGRGVSRIKHGRFEGTLANLRLKDAKIVSGRYKGDRVNATILASENVIVRGSACYQGIREIDGRVMSFRIENHDGRR
ncbi:hypothetical protein LO762_19960 [Actinocorallia sp. API 0066]|uniref:hypothetical protein n=1 Tax=Actinocorallia sp. API 0066 TaxID=2896846 RepID=UPI001E2A932D|nr:hypothetical protein [Actinocorallia sp. API 0066]MCD0451454.1 hypothetical protein [Actinocorallia sp. API 0066]